MTSCRAVTFGMLLRILVLASSDFSPDVIDVSLLQQNVEIQQLDFKQTQAVQTAVSPRKPKLLVLIVSCHKHAKDWPALLARAESAHPSGLTLILAGTPARSTMSNDYHVSLTNRTLLVNGNDGYDGLPEKMLRAFASVLSAPEFEDVTHVLKVDDSTVRDSSEWFRDDNLTMVENSLRSLPSDYVGPEVGYVVSNCSQSDPQEWTWGIDDGSKVPSTSFWFNRAFICDQTFTYMNGEHGYILSRNAVRTLVKHWPLESMEKLRRTHILEDYFVGLTLYRAALRAAPVSLPGMPTWDDPIYCDPAYIREHPGDSVLGDPDSPDMCTGPRCLCSGMCRKISGLCTSKVIVWGASEISRLSPGAVVLDDSE